MIRGLKILQELRGQSIRAPGRRGVRGIAALALLLTASIGSQDGFAIREADEELEVGEAPKVTGYMQYHFNYPIGGGEFAIGKHKDRGDKETIHGYYLTFVGKSFGQIGPVLSYDSINDTQDVRVTLGAYYGERNEDFRVLMNYEFRGAVDTGRFYLWSLVRF